MSTPPEMPNGPRADVEADKPTYSYVCFFDFRSVTETAWQPDVRDKVKRQLAGDRMTPPVMEASGQSAAIVPCDAPIRDQAALDNLEAYLRSDVEREVVEGLALDGKVLRIVDMKIVVALTNIVPLQSLTNVRPDILLGGTGIVGADGGSIQAP